MAVTFSIRRSVLTRELNMTTVIEGTIIQGLGAARTTVRLQMPHLVRQFPQVRGCYEATINLQLDCPLRVNNPDHTTGLIRWYPQASPEWAGKKFSFLGIKFECPLGEPNRDAWIYIPHDSPHRLNLFLAEIMTLPMDQTYLTPGTRCRIHVDKSTSSEVLIV